MRRVRGRKRAIATGAFILVMTLAGVPMAAAATVTVATAGDIARATIGTPQKKTADLVTAMRPAKVLVLGDAQYDLGEFSNFLQSYDPTWGSFNSIAAPVPGNAEYKTPNAAGYFQYFAGVLSPYGETATDPSKGYCSFNIGDWHVVALNSNCGLAGVNCTA